MTEHNPEFKKRYWTQQILRREASQHIPSEGENKELYNEMDEFDIMDSCYGDRSGLGEPQERPMTTLRTFTGTQSMGSIYNTEIECAAANLAEWATAGGMNSTTQALEAIADRDDALSELARDKWDAHELTVNRWDDVRVLAVEFIREFAA